jgi:outer membrane immunogenic protein
MSRRVLASFFAAASLAVAAGPALAADPMTPVPMWSGFYAGLHAGYGSGTDSGCGTWFNGSLPIACDPALPGNLYSVDGPFSGGLAGLQLGFNSQSGKWVMGAEIAASLTDLTHRNVSLDITEKTSPLVTATVHAGVAVGSSYLYGLVGYGGARQTHADVPHGCYWDVNVGGLVYGAGVQKMFGRMSVFAEWNHLAFNEVTASCYQASGNTYTNNKLKTTGDIIKAGINIHLN